MRAMCLALIILSILSISPLSYASPNHKPKPAPKTKTTVMTLSDAINLALRYDPTIKSAEIERVIDKFNLRLAHYNQFEVQYALTGSLYKYSNTMTAGTSSTSGVFTVSPTATWQSATPYGTQVVVTGANQLTHTYSSSTSANVYNPGVTVQVTQPLIQGASPAVVMAPWYNALDTERQNKLALKNTVMSEITTTISNYTAIIGDQNNIASTKENLQSAQQTLAYNQAKVKVGQAAPADLIQSESDISSAQVGVQQSQVQFLSDKYKFLISLGLNPNTPVALPNSVDFGDETIPPLQQAIADALENNISYQTELLTLRQDERALIVAKDQQRWQLNLVASRTQGNGSGGGANAGLKSLVNGENVANTVGLNLTVPIGNLTTQQKLVSAQVTLGQEHIKVEQLKLSTVTNVTNSYQQLMIQRQQVRDAEQAIVWAQKNYAIAQLKAKYGRATPLDLSTVRDALTTAQVNYVTAESNYINNLASFQATIGSTLDHWGIQIRY